MNTSSIPSGERGRGKLVEAGAIHLLAVTFISEHVTSWLNKRVAADTAFNNEILTSDSISANTIRRYPCFHKN